MTQNKFIVQLFSISLLVVTCTVITDLFSTITLDFSYISTSFFILISFVIYKLIAFSLKSENPTLFSQVFLLVTFFKMMLSILLVIIYFIIVRPTNLYFVIPFLINYAIFTVFEVSFMIKMAKQ